MQIVTLVISPHTRLRQEGQKFESVCRSVCIEAFVSLCACVFMSVPVCVSVSVFVCLFICVFPFIYFCHICRLMHVCLSNTYVQCPQEPEEGNPLEL